MADLRSTPPYRRYVGLIVAVRGPPRGVVPETRIGYDVLAWSVHNPLDVYEARNMVPTRPWADVEIEAAGVGHPCDIVVLPGLAPRLFAPTEVVRFHDCP